MTDVLTKEQRSRNMAAIKCKDTEPEKIVRSLIHRMGFRYSLHKKNLPGKPDIVLVSRRKVIQVHGCFWHMHKCKYGRVAPANNSDFWHSKRSANAARDKRTERLLRSEGWSVLTVWECRLKDIPQLTARLAAFLES